MKMWLVTTAIAGCVGSACLTIPRAEIAKRATFELGCPVSESDIVELGGYAYGVTACGCKATYMYASPGWALNGISGDKCQVRGTGLPAPASGDR